MLKALPSKQYRCSDKFRNSQINDQRARVLVKGPFHTLTLSPNTYYRPRLQMKKPWGKFRSMNGHPFKPRRIIH